MAVFSCKKCGGTLDISENQAIAKCKYCGTTQTLPKLTTDNLANLYERANHLRRNHEYDKAIAIYESILNENITDSEAYWSLVLCSYGIEYVEDPATKEILPTINRAQFTSVFDDENYKSAIKYATAEQKSIYKNEASEINEIQKGILAISQNEEPFDVFICYKETDENGNRTHDSVNATELYYQLTNEGFKVFFARITLEDKLGTAYEPYIFAALNSAKVMVVLGSKEEYFNAVWVRNEWSRYLSLVKKSAGKKLLIPVYRDMDAYDLPDEFSHIQAQDMSRLGFMLDLVSVIKKQVNADKPKPVAKETIVLNNNANTNIAPLLKRAFLFLEDEEWDSADEYSEKVLDIDPENAEAYLVKLLYDLEISNRKNLKYATEEFGDNPNFLKAMRFGNERLKSELRLARDYANEQIKQSKIKEEEKAREAARKDAEEKARLEKAKQDELRRQAQKDAATKPSSNTASSSSTSSSPKSGDKDSGGCGGCYIILIVAAIIAAVVFWVIIPNINENSEQGASSGNGEEQIDGIEITAASDLSQLANSKETFILANDIDLSGSNWQPIEGFKGTLNGNGHTIKNLTINSSDSNIGFFSTLGGTVSNLKFENAKVTVSGTCENIGILCGTLNGTINNITVSGSVSASKGTYVGGIAGYVDNSSSIKMSSLNNTANVSGADYVGGLIGYVNASSTYIYDSITLNLYDSSNTGDISGQTYVGGLFGYAYAEYSSSSISNCTNKSAIKGEAYVGCIAGTVENIIIKDCSNNGSTLEATGFVASNGIKYAYVGGYAGQGYDFENCENNITIHYTAGGQYVGGIAGYVSKSSDIEMSSLKNTASISGADYVGGLIGYVNASSTYIYDSITLNLYDSSNTGDISGQTYVGGLFGYAYAEYSSSSISSSYSSGTISATDKYGDIAGELINITIQ